MGRPGGRVGLAADHHARHAVALLQDLADALHEAVEVVLGVVEEAHREAPEIRGQLRDRRGGLPELAHRAQHRDEGHGTGLLR